MNLDDAIKHCEKIAMDKTNLAQTLWDSKEKARCKECAEEHNQLAQWLIELKMLKTEHQSSGSEKPNNCEMRDATLEERESIDKYIKSISKPTGVKFGALEQEPSRDIEEIEEVINCDADAETKCKMISNILTSKPHYFKEPQACEDAISREDAIKQCGFGMTNLLIADCLRKLPSVKPQERTGHWEWVQYDSNPNIGNWHCSECRTIIPHMPEETDNTPIYKWCPMCGAKMSENPTSSKPEISSYYGLKSYVRERSDKE